MQLQSIKDTGLVKRIESEIDNYITGTVEVSEGVHFSQYETIRRIYKFRNNDLSGTKLNDDLSYNYYYDIISPRLEAEIKNLRFDTKHILLFSSNPIKDFAAVFISNAKLKAWMSENGEDEKLKDALDEFSGNGNVGFKRVGKTYEIVDATNTYITNQTAKTVDDTDIIERYEMTASQLRAMRAWDQDEVTRVIKNLGNKYFKSTNESTPKNTSGKVYEIFEFSGEVSEKEYNAVNGMEDGDEDTFFMAKLIFAGLGTSSDGERHLLFSEKMKGKMSDYYIYAHRGRYNKRFWRVGMFEMLFDHQIRANQIGNDLARGLEWASKVIFRSGSHQILQNIRADMENGDVIYSEDLGQVEVRMQGMDQLIADWNRLMSDADRLANSFEIVRGENLPSGTPFRLGALLDQNAGMLFTYLRQRLALPFRRVFREWVLPELVRGLKGEDIFTLTGDTEMLDRLREIVVEKWYMDNLVRIGPHTKETAEAIKAEKLDDLREVDPTIENTKEIWKDVLNRMFVTITGENSDLADQITDLINLIGLEEDPLRRGWMLDQVYAIRGIPIPPTQERQPAEPQIVRGDPTAPQVNGAQVQQ